MSSRSSRLDETHAGKQRTAGLAEFLAETAEKVINRERGPPSRRTCAPSLAALRTALAALSAHRCSKGISKLNRAPVAHCRWQAQTGAPASEPPPPDAPMPSTEQMLGRNLFS